MDAEGSGIGAGAAVDAMNQAAVVYPEGSARGGIVSVGTEAPFLNLFGYLPVHADGTGLDRTIAIPYDKVQDCNVGGMLARIATTRPWLGLEQLTKARQRRLSFSVPRAAELAAAIQQMRTA